MPFLIANHLEVRRRRTSLLYLRNQRSCYFGPSRPSWCHMEVDTDGLLTSFPYGAGLGTVLPLPALMALRLTVEELAEASPRARPATNASRRVTYVALMPILPIRGLTPCCTVIADCP